MAGKSTHKISLIIGARNEAKTITFPITSFCMDIGKYDFEIIINDNNSTDDTEAVIKDTRLYERGYLKYIKDTKSNSPGASKGNAIAHSTGDIIISTDAHIIWRPGLIEKLVNDLDNGFDMVFPSVEWLGYYPHKPMYQYEIVFNEKFWGRLRRCNIKEARVANETFYVPYSLFAMFAIKREAYEAVGGYPKGLWGRNEESIFSYKMWMFDKTLGTNPQTLFFHPSPRTTGRQRTTHERKYGMVNNALYGSYLLGGEYMLDRQIEFIEERWKDIPLVDKQIIIDANKEEREWIKQNAKYTLEEIMLNRKWDKLNMEKFGKCHSVILPSDYPKIWQSK